MTSKMWKTCDLINETWCKILQNGDLTTQEWWTMVWPSPCVKHRDLKKYGWRFMTSKMPLIPEQDHGHGLSVTKSWIKSGASPKIVPEIAPKWDCPTPSPKCLQLSGAWFCMAGTVEPWLQRKTPTTWVMENSHQRKFSYIAAET